VRQNIILSSATDFGATHHMQDIRAVPLYKGAPHPQFTRACLHVVARAPALASFTWLNTSTNSALLSAILPLLAPAVPPTSAHRPPLVRISITDDNLSPSDAQLISTLGPVAHITLHKPSTAAIRALVDWISPASDADSHVQSLTLSHAYALHPDLLVRILSRAPVLRSLNITDAMHVPHTALFAVLVQTQLALESLSFTVSKDWNSATFPPLPTLRHVSIALHPPDEPVPDRYTDAPTDPLAQRLFRNLFTALPQSILHVRIQPLHDLKR
jgi:hypothetical protein